MMAYTVNILITVMFHLVTIGFVVTKASTAVRNRTHGASAGRISCALEYLASERHLGLFVISDGYCHPRFPASPKAESEELRRLLDKTQTEFWRLAEQKSTDSPNHRSYVFTTTQKITLCPIPLDVVNSKVVYISLLPDSKANYSCKDQSSGYCDGQSVKNVECLANGSWESFNDVCNQLVWISPRLESSVYPQCHLKAGFVLQLTGRSTHIIGISLHCGNKLIVFHMVMNLKSKKIGMITIKKRGITFNNKIGSKWGKQIVVPNSDIKGGQEFNITIVETTKGFKVYLGSRYVQLFAHRTPFQFIDRVDLKGESTTLKRLKLIL